MRSAASVGLLISFALAPVFACSSAPRYSGPSANADGGGGTNAPGLFVDGAAPRDVQYSANEVWADDPPPEWCGPANSAKKPPEPGGTPECPGDKNKEGCPCTKVGETASCFPGKRVNRNLGVCKDGKTTCIQDGEFGRVWSPCEDFVLPSAGATKGKEACKCFSEGQWKLDNLSPCLITESSGTYYASSAECTGSVAPPKTKPSTPWSKNTLRVDCAGHFKLCYTIKAGSVKTASNADCTVTSVCTEADYVEAGKEQAFPALPAWLSTDSACVEQFLKEGGYGEMSVVGESVLCDDVSDNGKPLVFQRAGYCPMDCDTRPNDADCKGCSAGGSGSF